MRTFFKSIRSAESHAAGRGGSTQVNTCEYAAREWHGFAEKRLHLLDTRDFVVDVPGPPPCATGVVREQQIEGT